MYRVSLEKSSYFFCKNDYLIFCGKGSARFRLAIPAAIAAFCLIRWGFPSAYPYLLFRRELALWVGGCKGTVGATPTHPPKTNRADKASCSLPSRESRSASSR